LCDNNAKIISTGTKIVPVDWPIFMIGLKGNFCMSKGICYIVGAGENYNLDFVAKETDYVIAADDGLSYLQWQGIAGGEQP